MVKNLMKDYDDYHDSMHSQLSSIKKVLKSNKKQQWDSSQLVLIQPIPKHHNSKVPYAPASVNLNKAFF